VIDAREQLRSIIADRRRLVLTLVLIAPIVFVLIASWRHRFIVEDGFINFRVVDQLRHGNGPVFNAGERVEAFTSPLWLAMLFVGDLVLPMRLEHIAVLFGIVLTVLAFVFAQLGSARVWRVLVGNGTLVPAGAIVLAALPPIWDFATSGLDGSLGLAWLSVVWWGVCVYVCDTRKRPPVEALPPLWLCVLVGLGPLVRPDLFVMTVAFLVVVCACQPSFARMGRVALLAAVVPVVYQVFRMAYYATLVPNTALTKEAGAANWARGWRYFLDFTRPYALVIPVALLVAAGLVPLLRHVSARRDRSLTLLVVAPVAAGIVHALFVVRVGGDFMHARLLLPSLWCLLLPVSVVIMQSWRWVPGLLILGWSLICVATLRTNARFETSGIGDARPFMIEQSGGRPNPVTIDDFRDDPWAGPGFAVRTLASEGKSGLILDGYHPSGPRLPIRMTFPHARIVVRVGNVGEFGYAAGPDVYVIDYLGLANPLASRTPGNPSLAAGHEKHLGTSWDIARFARPTSNEPSAVRDARRALRCGDLAVLVDDITGEVGIGDGMQNFVDSFHLRHLRLPQHPRKAVEVFCGSSVDTPRNP
jgi:arabinofuranosyltransferase